MALMSSTTRGPLARRHITPMGASGIWRGVGNSPPVGFTDTVVVTYQGGSVTIPAEQPATIYGSGGTLTALDLSNHAYCLFIVPGIAQLYACRQQDYAGIVATDNVVPLVYLQGPHDLHLPPRGITSVMPVVTFACVSASPTVQYLAGNESAAGYVDGPALTARFSSPGALAYGPDGTIYIVDGGNNAIRRYYPSSHTVDTLLTDGALVGVSTLDTETGHTIGGITVAASGDLYYMTTAGGVGQVKKVPAGSTTGTVIAGAASGGTTTLPAASSAVLLDGKGQCTLSPDGTTLYLPQPSLHKVWAMNLASGTVTWYAGNGLAPGGAGEPDLDPVGTDYHDPTFWTHATLAMFPAPNGVYFDATGRTYVTSCLFGCVSRVNADGSIIRQSGTDTENAAMPPGAYNGDGLGFYTPMSFSPGQEVGHTGTGLEDTCGNLFFTAPDLWVVRYVTVADNILHTLVGASRDTTSGGIYPGTYLTAAMTPQPANSVRLGGMPTGACRMTDGSGAVVVSLAGSGPAGHTAHGLLLIV